MAWVRSSLSRLLLERAHAVGAFHVERVLRSGFVRAWASPCSHVLGLSGRSFVLVPSVGTGVVVRVRSSERLSLPLIRTRTGCRGVPLLERVLWSVFVRVRGFPFLFRLRAWIVGVFR